MELATYTDLIKHLPFEEQSFETKRETWVKYAKHPKFSQFYNSIFTDSSVIISRSDLFHAARGDFSMAVFSIILWGYPRSMRGNSFKGVLEKTHLLKQRIQISQNLTLEDFETICNTLKGTGIGLSTLTKILYFFGITLESYRCLILDSRIIEVLQSGKFQELNLLQQISEHPKGQDYLDYLKLMAEITGANGYSVDQLELFLFMFGNSLKPIDFHKISGGIHIVNGGTSL
jgi:hypothetical protein